MKADRLYERAGNLTCYNDGTATSSWPEPLERVPGLCIVKYQKPSFVYLQSAAILQNGVWGSTSRFEPVFDHFVASADAR